MEFIKAVGGKAIGTAVAGIVFFGLVVGIITWYRNPEPVNHFFGNVGKLLGWLAAVALFPFVTFSIVGWVGRMRSNVAGAVLVTIYSFLGFLLLWWLFDFNIRGTTAWTFTLVGVLLVAAYNLLVCDWLAERME